MAWGDHPGNIRTDMQDEHLRIIRTMGDYPARVRGDIEPTASFAVAAAAALWGLPLTVLGRDNPDDIGPGHEDPIGYLYYTGEHYMVVPPDGDEPVRRAAELLAPVGEERPVVLDGGQVTRLVEAYDGAFTALGAGLGGLTDERARLRGEQILADARGRLGQPASAEVVMRLSHLYRRLRVHIGWFPSAPAHVEGGLWWLGEPGTAPAGLPWADDGAVVLAYPADGAGIPVVGGRSLADVLDGVDEPGAGGACGTDDHTAAGQSGRRYGRAAYRADAGDEPDSPAGRVGPVCRRGA